MLVLLLVLLLPPQAPDPIRHDLYEDVGSTSYSTFPRHSSPVKKPPVKSSTDYLQVLQVYFFYYFKFSFFFLNFSIKVDIRI